MKTLSGAPAELKKLEAALRDPNARHDAAGLKVQGPR